MRVLFVVNDLGTFAPGQTTAMLARAALARGHRVWVAPYDTLSLDYDGSVHASARALPAEAASSTDALVTAARAAPDERLGLAGVDLVCLRTNPGRLAASRAAHDLALGLLERAEAAGVRVRNAPGAVRRASSKLYLAGLPEAVRPPTAVSGDAEALRALLRASAGRTVLKPVEGTRGHGVMAVDRASLEERWPAVAALLAEGPVVAQPFVEAAEPGDVRVLVLDGAPLEVDGAVAAIARAPAPGDFRGNLHAGATARPATLTGGMRDALALVGPRLRAEGLALVGVDFVGDRIVELNVASPGGLRDAARFTGRDFAGAVMDRFLA